MARLQTRLMQALVVPAGIGFVAIAMYANSIAHGRLEAALAQKLTAVAGLVSETTNPRVVFLDEGDDETRTHRKAQTALAQAAQRAQVERIVVAHFEGQRALVDSAGRLLVGQEYGRARFDRVELTAVAEGQPAASVLFDGPAGRPYKTGYSPFVDREGRPVG
ncbi:MAG: two-component sensor histidine kinase, partial [Myxococcota bacterium]